MNILVIISFVVIMATAIILLNPRRIALRLSGINRYDLETVPYKNVVWVVVVSCLLLMVSIGLFIFVLKDDNTPIPEFIEIIVEWLNV
jgi:hypothetical protein